MMRTLVIAATLLSMACVSPRRVTRIEGDARPPLARLGSFDDFTPLVTPPEGESECYGPFPLPDGPGRIYGLRFATDPVRRIAIRVDEEGRVVHYSDLRGPISMPGLDEGPGDHTGILIDVETGSVVLRNDPAEGAAEVARTPSRGAMDSEALDMPGAWIEEIRARCMAAGS